MRISEQILIRAVELGMFYSMVEGVVFGVCGVDGDLGLLDVTDDVEGSIGLAVCTANATSVEAIRTGPSVV